ncbi:MAG: ribosomal protein S18-alanine N-acetyltransferase [Acidimicrobiia bacterium]
MTAARPDELPGPHVHIVPMRRRHLRSVLRIESQVYPRPWSLGAFLSEMGQRTSRFYVVAKEGGAVVGFAGLMVTLDEGHVTTIAVDPREQRRGVGARLLLTLSRAAIARGCHGLTLEVRVSNEPAQAMYRRFGYAPAGIRKGYYAETNEDALVMWAHDVDLPAYAERLDAIEAALAGTTSHEEGMPL